MDWFVFLCWRSDSIFRRGRSGQNDGAEDERGGRKEEDKRNRGENVFRGNQRAGVNVESKTVGMCAAIGSLSWLLTSRWWKWVKSSRGCRRRSISCFYSLRKCFTRKRSGAERSRGTQEITQLHRCGTSFNFLCLFQWYYDTDIGELRFQPAHACWPAPAQHSRYFSHQSSARRF